MSISKTFVAANVIYSHKFTGHDVLVSAFVASRACLPDLETTRPENLLLKEKVISLVQMQKKQTNIQIV